MPSTITHEELLFLELNTELGRAVKTHTMVEALKIAGGAAGPWSYYLMLAAGDVNVAAKLQSRALLVGMMNAH